MSEMPAAFDEAGYQQELEANRQAFEAMRETIRSQYIGQFVALAFGRIVASGKRVADVNAAIEKLRPAPKHVEVFPANEEPLFDAILDPYMEFLPGVTVCNDDAAYVQHMPANRRFWETERDRLRRDHAGQFLAIAHGRLIVVAPTFEAAEAAVLQLQPRPTCYLVFPANDEPILDHAALQEKEAS